MSLSDLASTGVASCERQRLGNRALLGSLALVRIVCAAAIVVGGLLAVPPVLATGFWVYEMGTPDLGTASAGRAASARDAAAVFGNPAGLMQISMSARFSRVPWVGSSETMARQSRMRSEGL